jgi:hypothetical protein
MRLTSFYWVVGIFATLIIIGIVQYFTIQKLKNDKKEGDKPLIT